LRTVSRIVLGVTGSVAAIKTPELASRLRSDGHEVRVVATERALAFFKPGQLEGVAPLYRDLDEWPSGIWSKGDPVLHIEFRSWADVLIIAPLDAHTLGKIALGLCDNFLTCIARAWELPRKPAVFAPAMNTRMWEHPATRRHLQQILEDWSADGNVPSQWDLNEIDKACAQFAPGLVVVPPQAKVLACGDLGVGAMAEVGAIAEAVRVWSESTARTIHQLLGRDESD
jgi:phosphopantothenoylcysteine decarboxylase